MGKLRKPFILISTAASLLSLTSCTIYALFPESSSPESSVDISKDVVSEGVYKSEDFLNLTMRDVSYQRGMDLVPSVGDVNVLVLPIEFTDFPFSESTLSNVSKALSGTDNSYWESVASFYEKSSYGKLHLNFHMAPIYETGCTAREAAKNDYAYGCEEELDKINGQRFVNEAVEQYDDPSAPLAYFDQDSNGIIDAVIAVYSCPDYTQRTYSFTYDRQTHIDGNLFWAYTYWCSNDGDLSSPKANTYVWLSYDFFTSGGEADPHILIHEFGHAMGLDDYYNSSIDFQPTGGIDMMDMNITDHDAYSKCALGWTSPYIIDGDDVTLTIRPSASSGDCVLIPTASYNGTLYDEYMLLELYTPDGLNELDSKKSYMGKYPRGYTVPGVKIYHIDSRLISTYFNRSSYTSSPYVKDPNSIDPDADDVFYFIGATNCSKEYNSSLVVSSNRDYSSDFSLIHLMEATGRNSFSKGSSGTNDTLFKKGSNFSFKRFGSSFFPNKTTMNNGRAFPYTITITALSDEGATIHFVKNA